MLTRDLLRYGLRQGVIFPRFLDVDNRASQGLAAELIGIYAEGVGQSAEELAELTQPAINAHRSPLIAKGLNKLLLERCAFREPTPEAAEFRLQLLEAANAALSQPNMGDLEAFRNQAAGVFGLQPDEAASRLYADLPLRQPLTAFDAIEPPALLARYNLALAQGLLLGATGLTVEFSESHTVRRRRFFQHLKFHRLLARIEKTGRNAYRLRLDGPLSLFSQTRKYGVQFANFLPWICALAQWSLEAEIQLGRAETGRLTLDQDSGLVAEPARVSGYRPEEFDRLAAGFKEKLPEGWKVLPEAEILHPGGQDIWVPDFSVRRADGVKVHLELFHRWHATPLLKRLEALERPRKDPVLLAIGVDRALEKEAKIKQRLADSDWFRRHGFLFNEIPPVKRAAAALSSFPAQEASEPESHPKLQP